MPNAPSGSEDRLAKVVLIGTPGVGKSVILKAVAEQYAHGSIRAGEIGEGKIFRTEFFWPEVLPGGGRLRIRLFALSGRPVYNAITELVLAEADGIVFVANLARDQGPAAQEALETMVRNAKLNKLDLATLPVAMHYHQPLAGPVPTSLFKAEEMDQLLGLAPGSVVRFVTDPGDNGLLRGPVEWIAARIASGGKDLPNPVRADGVSIPEGSQLVARV